MAFAAIFSVVGVAGAVFPTVSHAGPTYAIVDLDKAYQESKQKTAQDLALEAYAKQLQTAYRKQQDAVMLAAEQQKNLGQLLLKDPQTASDVEQIKTLTASSDADLSKLKALQDKQDKSGTLTDTEKLDYQALSAQARAGQQTLQEINQAYQQQWDLRNQEVRDEITAKIKEAVSTVAQKQGIQVVFSSQAAVYASTDITKDVIAVINK
jgi:Skp family chaperone for outer membrane proteins